MLNDPGCWTCSVYKWRHCLTANHPSSLSATQTHPDYLQTQTQHNPAIRLQYCTLRTYFPDPDSDCSTPVTVLSTLQLRKALFYVTLHLPACVIGRRPKAPLTCLE
jgi:hypothetical protein